MVSFIHFTGDEDPLDGAIRSLELNFELPNEFRHPEKFNPTDVTDEFIMDVPQVVGAAIFEAIGDNVPINPQVPLIYLQSGRLPQFVVAWFMAAMPTGGKRLAKSTKFFRALHAVERYREYVLFPADPSVPEYILAGAGAVPLDHFLPGSHDPTKQDDVTKQDDDTKKDDDTKEDDETKEEEDGHNVGFLDEKEEEEK